MQAVFAVNKVKFSFWDFQAIVMERIEALLQFIKIQTLNLAHNRRCVYNRNVAEVLIENVANMLEFLFLNYQSLQWRVHSDLTNISR